MKPRRNLPLFVLLLSLLSYPGYGKEKPKPVYHSIHNIPYRDSIRQVRFNEVDFIIDQIEHTYVSGRRGMSDEEWNRRVAEVYEVLNKRFFYRDDYMYTWRYIGALKNDAHFPFPDNGMLNREWAFSKTDTIFPLWVQTWTDGSVYNVKDYTGVIPPQAQIISVNGHSAKAMALKNRTMSQGEEANAMAEMNVKYEADPLYWSNFANFLFTERIKYPFEVIYTVPGKEMADTVLLNGIPREEKYELFKKSGDKRRNKAERGSSRKPIIYRRVADSIGVLTINQFWGKRWTALLIFRRDWRYKRLLRGAMRRIDRQDIRDLVIDISLNPGGMTENVYYTLNYLTDKPVDIHTIYHLTDNNRKQMWYNVKLSTELPKADREYLGGYIDTLKAGSVFCTDTVRPLQYIPNNPKHRFKGNVYILTGYQTYSAGQMFARYCQTLGIGAVAGQHCGGYNDITGNASQIALPSYRWMAFQVPFSADRICLTDDPYDYPPVDRPIELRFDEWLNRENHSLERLIDAIKTEL